MQLTEGFIWSPFLKTWEVWIFSGKISNSNYWWSAGYVPGSCVSKRALQCPLAYNTVNWGAIIIPISRQRKQKSQTAQCHRAHDWSVWGLNSDWIVPGRILVITVLNLLPHSIWHLWKCPYSNYSQHSYQHPGIAWYHSQTVGYPGPCSFVGLEGQEAFHAYFLRSLDKFNSHNHFHCGPQRSFLWRPSKFHVPRLTVQGWVHAQSLQLCLTLCDPIHCSPPGSSVHGVLQARILEWITVLLQEIFSTQGLSRHL